MKGSDCSGIAGEAMEGSHSNLLFSDLLPFGGELLKWAISLSGLYQKCIGIS